MSKIGNLQPSIAKQQKSAIESLKQADYKLTDSKGLINEKNFKLYITNIQNLGNKNIKPETGLLTGKGMTGFNKDAMKADEIKEAVLKLSLFGGKTRKYKKSKTLKRGRYRNKSRKY